MREEAKVTKVVLAARRRDAAELGRRQRNASRPPAPAWPPSPTPGRLSPRRPWSLPTKPAPTGPVARRAATTTYAALR